MKSIVVTLVAAAATLTASAWAQEAIPPDTFVDSQIEGQYLAKDLLLNAKVYNAQGQIIGDIEDLILNEENQVEGVVMGTGGFAGIGEKKVGVWLSALQFSEKDGARILTLPQATKEVLTAIPAFTRAQPRKSLVDRAIEKAKELTDKSTETAKDAYEKASKEAGPALESAQKAAKEAYDKAKEAYEKATEAAKSASPPAADPAQK